MVILQMFIGMEKMGLVDSEMYKSLGLYGSDSGTPRVLFLISSLLDKAIAKNEKVDKKGVMSIFHGQRAPALSVGRYLERIFKYANCSTCCFLLAYMYMDSFVQQTASCLTSLNVHRLLITSVMVAAKYADDECHNNAYYAKVGGVSTAEMNRLEMKLLFSVDFRVHVTVETFRRMCTKLEKEAVGEYPIEVGKGRNSSLKKHETRRSTKIAHGYSCTAI